MSDYLMGIEGCGWLRHVKAVVDAAIFLTKVSPHPLHYATHFLVGVSVGLSVQFAINEGLPQKI